jgi:hypothetical protein
MNSEYEDFLTYYTDIHSLSCCKAFKVLYDLARDLLHFLEVTQHDVSDRKKFFSVRESKNGKTGTQKSWDCS